jgi:hypothetical protein
MASSRGISERILNVLAAAEENARFEPGKSILIV